MNLVLQGSLSYGAGTWAGLTLAGPWPCWILGLLGCTLWAAGVWKHRKGKVFLQLAFLGFLFCAGGLQAGLRVPAARRMAPLQERTVTLIGRVVPGSVVRTRQGGMAFLLDEERGRVRVFLKKASFPLQVGRVEVTGWFLPPDGFYNPGCQRPEERAAIQGEGGKLQSDSAHFRLLSGEPSWQDKIWLWGEAFRRPLRQTMDPEISALLEGMLLGGSSQISPEVLRLFQRCGLSHLLSVSGSHVALLLGLLTGTASFFRIPRKAALPLLGLLLVGYGVLCGLRASVCRALILGLGTLWGNTNRHRAEGTAFLGLAGILLLSWHPWWILDPGFQLSFSAALGLMTLRQPVAKGLDQFLPGILAKGLAVPISAQLLSLPFLVHHFHMLSLVSLLANLLLVPLLSFCLTGSTAGALLGMAGLDFLAGPVLAGVSCLLRLALWAGEWIARLPGTQLVTGSPSPWLWPLYFLMVLGLLGKGWFLPRRERLRRWTLAAASTALCLELLLPHFRQQPFTVYFLDVGQGDCAVLVTPEREIILVDTGGLNGKFDPGERILVPFLRYLGAEKVDLVLLSHGHQDHAGGLAGLARWLPVNELMIAQGKDSKYVKNVLCDRKLRENIKIVYKIQTNQKIRRKKSILEIVEAPKTQNEGGEENENSAIVRVSCGGRSILFTGDAPAETELAAAQKPIRSDVLKVSHHGSKTSSDAGFLAAAAPRLAVVSAGRRNRFGHPHPETLDRLEQFGIPLARTDQEGAIKVIIDEWGPVWYSYRWQQDCF